MQCKRFAGVLATVVAALVVSVSLGQEKQEKKTKKEPDLKGIKCPVSGKAAINCTADYKGAKVYFCCGECPDKFKEETAKFAAKANHQLYATKQATLKQCVFTCKKLNGETVIEIEGTKVCFCCEDCKEKATGADDKIACVFNDKQFANGFEVGKTKKVKKEKKEK